MIQLEEKEFGYIFQVGPYFGGFGNRRGTLEKLKKQYSSFSFFGVKQTHSDIAHIYNQEASDQCEADAIIGCFPGIIYYIKTADCVPVLLIDENSKAVSCIHAGWKGVANRIVPKTIQKFLSHTKSSSHSLTAIIGPHIQKPSFEIEVSVLEQLKGSVSYWPDEVALARGSKYDADLNLVVKLQLEEMGLSADQVNSLMIDTKTNLDFHSYRRDRENSGRQISFIGRLA